MELDTVQYTQMLKTRAVERRMIDTLYQADIFVRIFCQEYSGAYFLLGDFGSVGGRK